MTALIPFLDVPRRMPVPVSEFAYYPTNKYTPACAQCNKYTSNDNMYRTHLVRVIVGVGLASNAYALP